MSRLTAKEPLCRYGLFSDEERESMGYPTSDEIYNKLKEYEDAEEQGRLIKLPYKVGDKVYLTNYFKIIEEKIENIRLSIETQSQIFNEWEFGRDLFFTREEAEAALEKMKGE